MAVGNLDIGIQVDATSATAGFNKAAAQAQRFGKQLTTIGRDADTMARGYNRSMTSMRASTANMAAQFQDIGVSLASGQSPFLVAIQQGAQLSAAMTATGASVKTLGAAFMTMFGPVSLITIGLTAAVGLAAQYLATLNTGAAKSAEDRLKEHKQLIEDIEAAWPGATKGVEDYAKKANIVLIDEAAKRQAEDEKAMLRDLAAYREQVLGGDIEQQTKRSVVFSKYATQWSDFVNQLRQGASDYSSLTAEVDKYEAAQGRRATAEAVGGRALEAEAARIAQLTSTGYPELDRILRMIAADLLENKNNSAQWITELENAKRAAHGVSPELEAMIDAELRRVTALQASTQASTASTQANDALNTSFGRTPAAANAAAGGIAAAGAAAQGLTIDLASAAAQMNRYNDALLRLANVGLPALSEAQQAEQDYAEAVEAAHGNQMLETRAVNARADAHQRLADRAREAAAAEAAAAAGRGGGGGAGARGGGGGAVAKATDANRAWLDSLLDAGDATRAIQRDIDKLNAMMATQTGSTSEYAAAMAVLEQRMREVGGAASDSFDAMQTFGQIMDSWGQQVASSLADAIVEGENLEDVFKDLLKQLLKMIIQMMILEPLMKSVMGGFGSMGGGGTGGGSWAPAGWFGRSQRALASPGTYARAAPGRSAPGGGHTVYNSSTGVGGNLVVNVPINSDIIGNGDRRAVAMAKKIKAVVTRTIVDEQRPGGLLWAS